jgi:hypothetical protein
LYPGRGAAIGALMGYAGLRLMDVARSRCSEFLFAAAHFHPHHGHLKQTDRFLAEG